MHQFVWSGYKIRENYALDAERKTVGSNGTEVSALHVDVNGQVWMCMYTLVW